MADKRFVSLFAAFIVLVGSFTILTILVSEPRTLNQIGIVAGLYGIFAALYMQFSDHFIRLTAFDEAVGFRVPITLYMVGAVSVFHSVRITTTNDIDQWVIDPILTTLANSIVFSLVTGWVVFSYLIDEETVRNGEWDDDSPPGGNP